MTPYSYRKSRLSAIFLVLLAIFISPAYGQYGKRSEVLRGTAVLENVNDGFRLIPVCIYLGGKFYDAGFYQSTPVPMSLIQGTIYEVQKSGQPLGNFNVNDAVRDAMVHAGLVN